MGAIVAGAWAAYERRRRRGIAEEPPIGTWRGLFGLLVCLPVAGLGVLLAV